MYIFFFIIDCLQIKELREFGLIGNVELETSKIYYTCSWTFKYYCRWLLELLVGVGKFGYIQCLVKLLEILIYDDLVYWPLKFGYDARLLLF